MTYFYKMTTVCLISMLLFPFFLTAQNVGIGTTTPNNSAKLDISSTNSGILIPRMTTAQRTAITTPATGLLVFDNNSTSFWFFNGTIWTNLGTNTDNQDLSLTGNTLSLTNDGTTVNLSSFLDNTDNQNLSLAGKTLSISNGNNVLLPNESRLIDNDNDTKIDVEESPDEDIIRFDIAGNEKWAMIGNRINHTGNNLLIGQDAGLLMSTGQDNIALGLHALRSGQINNGSIAIGKAAMANNTNGNFSISIGFHSLVTDGAASIAVGAYAGENGGNNSVYLGHAAGRRYSPHGVVFIGHHAGHNENRNDKLYIENSQSSSPLIYGEFDNDILRVNGTFQINNPTGTGFTFPAVDGTTNQVLQTNGAGQLAWTTPSSDAQTLSIVGNTLSILNGNSISLPSTTKLIDADNDTKIDVEESTDEDIIRFDLAGVEKWVMRGERLEYINSNRNLFIGSVAGQVNTGTYNTYVGDSTAQANTTGSFNTAFGTSVLYNNTTGQQNTGIGCYALHDNTTGGGNTAVGQAAMWYNTIGSNNTTMGDRSLLFNTFGSANTTIGATAFFSNTSGSNNTALGEQAGRNNLTGSGNIFLGYQAGQNETGSNKLYIENSNSATPLIYGDFATNQLTFNGTTATTGNATINGNVGIGTTTPSSKVEVADITANAAQAITIRNADVRVGMEIENQAITNLGEAIMNVGVNTGRGILQVGTNPAAAWFRVDTRAIINKFTWFWKNTGSNPEREIMSLNNAGNLVIAGSATKPGGGAWNVLSDARLKKNIQNYKDGLSTLMKISTKTFQYNGKGGIQDTDKKYVGIIAQELQKIAPYMIHEVELNHPVTKESETYLEFDPSALDFMLINATQELAKRLEKAENENQQLKEKLIQLEKLETRLERLETKIQP